MIKAVLFDVDGVIYDDNRQLIDFHKKAAKSLGIRVPSDLEIYKHFGKSWDEMVDTIWPGVDAEKFRKTYLSIMEKEDFLPIFNGDVKGILEVLRTKFNLGVIFSENKDLIQKRLKNDGIYHYFDILISSESLRGKNRANPLLEACKKLEVKPFEAVYISDDISGYYLSKEAGVHFVAFIWDGIENFPLLDLKPKFSVEKFGDIPSVVQSIAAN